VTIIVQIITRHSINRAADEAVQLWALASAQYPKQHERIISVAAISIIEVISSFALNARRALEALPPSETFPLAQPRWQWVPISHQEVVGNLWDALNRIIHAKRLEVGFEQLPQQASVIDGGVLVVPYIRAATDRKELAFIDPFALSHAFLYGAYPRLEAIQRENPRDGLN
jgi:hypothetical protein